MHLPLGSEPEWEEIYEVGAEGGWLFTLRRASQRFIYILEVSM